MADFVKKFMQMAKISADNNKACQSRQIGSIIASADNRILAEGYNGALEKCPHSDSEEWTQFLWENVLTDTEKLPFFSCQQFSQACEGKCPRKVLNISSGERMEICPCSHSERNAIFNAARQGISVKEASIFCWCGIPCHECSIGIVQAGIKKVYCLKQDGPDYSPTSRKMFQMAGIEVIELDPNTLEPV